MHPEHPERAKLEPTSQTAHEIESSLGAVEAVGDVEEFLRLIEPLELAAGKILEGDGRSVCLNAFQAFPHGFGLAAARALRDGRNPLGLLIWMVQRRHHEKFELAAERSGQLKRASGACFICGAEGLLTQYVGQLWCEQHYDEQRAFDGEVSL